MDPQPPAPPGQHAVPVAAARPGHAGWPRAIAWSMSLVAVVAVAWLVTGLLRQCTPTAVIQGGGAAAQGIVREGGEQVRATPS